jgi:APA family basic amino acid/polyamine antiporter
MIPIAGSAYTYAYATLGELVAWIIGWDLILEYAVSNMAVAVGFSAYLQRRAGQPLRLAPAGQASPPPIVGGQFTGNWFKSAGAARPADPHLDSGDRRARERHHQQRDGADQDCGHPDFRDRRARAVNTSNWQAVPAQRRISGVLTGAAIVFFTYIGFDSVSTAAEECRRPQRDLPFGIIMTLVICAVLYISVALVLTGIAWRHPE